MKNKFCDTIKSSKKLLRKEMQLVLNNLSQEDRRRQSEAVLQELKRLPQYQNSRNVSIYLSMDDEINTTPILRDMFKSGKEVFVPKFKGKMMEMVKLYSMEDLERLPTTKWNIKQPADNDIRQSAPDSRLDLICLPGLAFTKCGKRLGHGMGYYDKYLNMYVSTQRHRPYLVALAFSEQLLDDVPTDQHDFNLDLVLTERNSNSN